MRSIDNFEGDFRVDLVETNEDNRKYDGFRTQFVVYLNGHGVYETNSKMDAEVFANRLKGEFRRLMAETEKIVGRKCLFPRSNYDERTRQ